VYIHNGDVDRKLRDERGSYKSFYRERSDVVESGRWCSRLYEMVGCAHAVIVY
jgi:hypothetical protein